jgi:transcriptional regulator with XRE-family HTH domain
MEYVKRGDIMDTVKSVLHENRLKLHYTKAELAKKVGVNASTITRWESGEVANMTRRNMIRLSEVLKISPLDLLGISDNAQNHNILPSPPPGTMLSKDEKLLLSLYNQLDREDKAEIRGEIRGMLKSEKYQNNDKKDEVV